MDTTYIIGREYCTTGKGRDIDKVKVRRLLGNNTQSVRTSW